MTTTHIQILDKEGVQIGSERFKDYGDAESFIKEHKTGHIFNLFEEEPLLFPKGDIIKYIRNESGSFDVVRIPL